MIGRLREVVEKNRTLDREQIFSAATQQPDGNGTHYMEHIQSRCRQIPIRYNQEQQLPGPTGETNTLRLGPRGILVCLGGGGDDHDLERQVVMSLASGNGAIVACDDARRAHITNVVSSLEKAGLPSELVQFISENEISAYLHAEIDGCVCSGDRRVVAGEILCRRDGPILPVLHPDDDPERFCVERTLTINTTAAGGNASLLAL